MKVLFVGDPHLKITRFELAKKFLSWLDETIKKHKPDLVVNLGDTFDTHAVMRSEVMTEFMNHVYSVLAQNIEYVYLLGNHDMYKPSDSKYHAMLPFKGKIPKLYVIDQVTELHGMTFVPYQHDPSRFPRKTLSICVAHQTFDGADYGAIRAKDQVDPGSVVADIIVSGHIHKRQSICGAKVLYPGSPFSQSASDVDQDKGLMLFDTDTFKHVFIKCPLPMWRSMKFEITPSFTIEQMHSDIVNRLTKTDHWVLDITGPRAEIVGYLSSKQSKELFSDVDVKIKTTFTDKEKRQVKIEAISMEQIISEYVAKVYSGSLDKSTLSLKALEILRSTK